MVDNPKKADHEDLVAKFKKYVKALPAELGIACIREYYSLLIEEMEKMCDKNTYTKAKLLGTPLWPMALINLKNSVKSIIVFDSKTQVI